MLPLSQTIWIPRWPVKITQREEAFRSHCVDSWGQNIIVLSSWLLTECSLNCTTPAWRLTILHGSASIIASFARARWLSKPASAEDALCFRSGEITIHLQTKACLYLLNIHSKNKTIIRTTGRQLHFWITYRRFLVVKSWAACKFLQDCTSCPGTQERLLSFKSKCMIQMSQGEWETHLAALQTPGQWREIPAHIKWASCQQATSGMRDGPSTTARSSGRTHLPCSLGKPVHRAFCTSGVRHQQWSELAISVSLGILATVRYSLQNKLQHPQHTQQLGSQGCHDHHWVAGRVSWALLT